MTSEKRRNEHPKVYGRAVARPPAAKQKSVIDHRKMSG